MDRVLFVLTCSLVWLVIGAGTALAQAQPPELMITFHDVADTPVAGITVLVRDGSGAHELARATTTRAGVVTFSGLPERQVRVAIVGRLLNGTKLYQAGNDAQGIVLLLDPAPTVLDLRSEVDGMVVPDPASMAALELGVPVATTVAGIPTAPLAPRMPRAPTTPTRSAPASSGAVAPAVPIAMWLGIGLLVVLISTAVGIIVIQRRSI